MAKNMSDKAASGRSNAAAIEVEGNHHHHHHPYFVDQHRSPTAVPAPDKMDCTAEINNCAGMFIQRFHQQLEVQHLQSMNQKHSGGMAKNNMSDKAASGRSNAAGKAEGNNQHHHHHPYFVDDQHRAQTAPAPDRMDCTADIDDCAGVFIERFHQQLEVQHLQSMNQKHGQVQIDGRG